MKRTTLTLALLAAVYSAFLPIEVQAAPRLATIDPLLSVGGEKSAPIPEGPLQPIRLVVPLNGIASAQVVVVDEATLPAITAKLGPLALADRTKLPPTAGLTVRYASVAEPKGNAKPNPKLYFDTLLDAPVKDTLIQPIWLTVAVPADAKAGVYTGSLAVTVGGKTTPVPVELTVSDWKVPNPRDGQGIVGLFPSFDAPANFYKVPLWSDKHWALLEKSLQFLGRTGNDIIHIPLVAGTFISEKQSILTFKQSGAEFVPDFTNFDKYLALYDKLVGPPKILVLDVWDSGIVDARKLEKQGGKASLDYIVNTGGNYEPVAGPFYGDPGSEKIWKATLDGVKASLKKAGWNNTIVILGTGNDARPSAEVGQFFDALWPGIMWNMFTHGRGDPKAVPGQILEIAGIRYLLNENPDGKAGRNPGLKNKINPGDVQGRLVIDGKSTLRMSSTRHNWVEMSAPPHKYRALPDVAMGKDSLGLTRYGLDYWNGVKYGGWFNLWRNNATSLITPGPDGPVSTVRFEMLVEGTQELEARLVLEDATTNKTISGDLLTKVNDFLVERRAVRTSGAEGNDWVAGPDWQKLTQRLYDLAGEVTRAAKKS